MSRFIDRLRAGPAIILDGGMGTMLMARGLASGAAPEVWNVERSGDVEAVHREYVEAGSEAVHTNTFGATPMRLEHFGLAGRCAELNGAAVRAARASGAAFVIADIGPTGEYMPPVGQASESEIRRSFEAQATALAEASPDAFHIETMTDLREALIAIEAIRSVARGIPVMSSMTFERKKRGFFTVMGNALAASLNAMAQAGADAVGANCTLTSVDFRALAQEARAAVSIPVVMQPNAGMPVLEGDRMHYEQPPESYAEDAAACVEIGVAAIGGCCGTDPRFIRALVTRLGRNPQ